MYSDRTIVLSLPLLQHLILTQTLHQQVIEANHILPYHTTKYSALKNVKYTDIYAASTKTNKNNYTVYFLHNRTKPNQETQIIIIYRQLLSKTKPNLQKTEQTL